MGSKYFDSLLEVQIKWGLISDPNLNRYLVFKQILLYNQNFIKFNRVLLSIISIQTFLWIAYYY